MLYHASNTGGLKVLLPHTSTHGEKYVYAIKNRLTALLFGAPKDDFDLLMDEENGRTVVYECYPNALKKIYAGKTCSLYEVADDGFLAGQTGWEPELVCKAPVKVVHEEKINDIYACILEAADNGECILREYAENERYQEFICDEIAERIRAFGMTEEQRKQDPRFELYFNRLLFQK